MANLDYILEQIADVTTSVRRSPADLNPGAVIEFLDTQRMLTKDVLYLTDEKTAEKLLPACQIEAGTIIFVCSVTGKNFFTVLPSLMNCTVAEISCSPFRLYNMIRGCMPAISGKEEDEASVYPVTEVQRLKAFWREMRTGKLAGAEEIRTHLKGITSRFKPYYALLIITWDTDRLNIDIDQIVKDLSVCMPDSVFFQDYYRSSPEIIGIAFQDSQHFSEYEQEDSLRSLLEKNLLKMMCSGSTRDYGKMNTLYRLTRRASYLCSRLNLDDSPVQLYERYSMYSVIDLCTQRYIEKFGHSDILYLVHPIVVYLTRYDEDHNTNLRDFLYYYLLNGKDIKKTAADLFVHRNTVTNKLHKIRQIAPIDFDDGGMTQRLLFSCQLVRYYERVMKLAVRRKDEFQ